MTKRISNKLTNKEAEDKAYKTLHSKKHTVQLDMSTYTATNDLVRVYCNGCNLDKMVRFNNICVRGCKCRCVKVDKPKPIKQQKEPKSLMSRWIEGDYNNRIAATCPNLIPIPQSYSNVSDPMRMYCTQCECIIDKRVSDAVKGYNCVNCYGVGFNKDIGGVLYVLKVMDSTGNVLAYKLGITNKTALERCEAINKNTIFNCEVIYSYSAIGSRVQAIESLLKKTIECKYLPKSLMNDGSTETFSPVYVMDVIKLLFTYCV